MRAALLSRCSRGDRLLIAASHHRIDGRPHVPVLCEGERLMSKYMRGRIDHRGLGLAAAGLGLVAVLGLVGVAQGSPRGMSACPASQAEGNQSEDTQPGGNALGDNLSGDNHFGDNRERWNSTGS